MDAVIPKIDSCDKVLRKAPGGYRTFRPTLNYRFPQPWPQCHVGGESCGLELTVAVHKTVDPWHREIQLVGDCFHRQKLDVVRLRTPGHCSCFHIDGQRSVGFRQLRFPVGIGHLLELTSAPLPNPSQCRLPSLASITSQASANAPTFKPATKPPAKPVETTSPG